MTRDDELTPQEQERLRTLPREHLASRALEDRTVAALRAHGIVRPARTFAPLRVALAAAAGLALFAGGVLFGEWRSSARPDAEAVPPSERVRAAGSAYVSAIGDLTRRGSGTASEELDDARVAAVEVLHQAAGEVMLLAPGEPVAEGILAGFDQAAARERGDGESVRRIVWF